MQSLTSRLARLLRGLRTRQHRWTPETDRRFHDRQYAAQDYDPFTPAYPGYLSIRRFADLASPHIAAGSLVVDLGCGPGEITCELARRHPSVSFAGLDHSEEAIARGVGSAARLGLANVRFRRADVARIAFDERPDLVVMFDAFHHIVSPEAFLRTLRARCDRFFFIEPAGTWHGGWAAGLAFEWLLKDLESIRAHLSHVIAAPRRGAGPTMAPRPSVTSEGPAGEAVGTGTPCTTSSGSLPA